MKSPEERKADREARLIANVSGPRTGYIRKSKDEPTEPSLVIQGLEMSEVLSWPLDRFKPHPSNHVFDSAKSETYWRDLKRDILEAGAILNPLIVLPDGTLLEGHSRLRIAEELKAEGHDLGRIPVRVVSSPITPEEAERRVYLGNLSRFEVDEDTRLNLYRKVWPDYFGQEGKAGRPTKNNRATVSPFPTTAQEIAKETGKSVRTIKSERAILRDAARRARDMGKPDPDIEDIRETRAKLNAQRRAKANPPGKVTAASGKVTVQLSRGHAVLVLRILRRVKLPKAPAEVIRNLEEALRGKR